MSGWEAKELRASASTGAGSGEREEMRPNCELQLLAAYDEPLLAA